MRMIASIPNIFQQNRETHRQRRLNRPGGWWSDNSWDGEPKKEELMV